MDVLINYIHVKNLTLNPNAHKIIKVVLVYGGIMLVLLFQNVKILKKKHLQNVNNILNYVLVMVTIAYHFLNVPNIPIL